MAKHRYPRDLHAILRRRWRGEPLADGWPRVDLPEKAVLDELLDVCYHASLLTEEGRPTIFRVAFISGSTPVSPPRREPVPLEPIMRYALCPAGAVHRGGIAATRAGRRPSASPDCGGADRGRRWPAPPNLRPDRRRHGSLGDGAARADQRHCLPGGPRRGVHPARRTEHLPRRSSGHPPPWR